MSDFAEQLSRFVDVSTRLTEAVFEGASDLALQSIQDGSAITGAPGQRVDTGYMKGGFIMEIESKERRLITTNVAYAPVHEFDDPEAYDPSGVDRPEGFTGTEPGAGDEKPSTVGGPHSVDLTITGWPKLVEHVQRNGGPS